MLAAALMAAAAPYPEPAEITIKIDLNSDSDATRNFNAPLENPGLDISSSHDGDPVLNEPPYNLHYNFSLLASVTKSPPKPWRPECDEPPHKDFIVGYPRGVQFAEFGVENSNFTLCRGKVLYDNSVFTIGPQRNPNFVYLGSSDQAQIFKTEKKGGKLYLRFTKPNVWFASLNCAPRKGDRVAALEGNEGRRSLILFFSYLFLVSLSLSLCLSSRPVPKRREWFMLTVWGDLPSIEENAFEVELEIVELPPLRHYSNSLANVVDVDDDTAFEESQPTRELV